MEALRLVQDDVRAEESLRARRQVLIAEKDLVLDEFHRGTLSMDAFNALLASVDARMATVESTPPNAEFDGQAR